MMDDESIQVARNDDDTVTLTLEGEAIEQVKALIEYVVKQRGWQTAYIFFTAAIQLMDQATAAKNNPETEPAAADGGRG
jgi:hypothetical protein